jgi:glycosyltransferase involved in cell wall biosynthesis
MGKDHISICICTFRRPELLRRLLVKLQALVTNGLFDYSVVVVDNDERRSAEAVAKELAAASAFTIQYHFEPERSISLARNRSVRAATGNLVAFIDDDEFPEPSWLLTLRESLYKTGADGVLGPVLPELNGAEPAWLVGSGLLDRERFKTGTILNDSRYTRTGNVLIWKRIFEEHGYFDPKYGRSGGGDAVFFGKMIGLGKKFTWCDEAPVYESVPQDRQTRSYYLRRACTRGMTSAWEIPFFSRSTAKSLAAVSLYSAALPFLFVGGQHLFMRYLVKDCDHLSKLLAYLRIRLVAERPYETVTVAVPNPLQQA